MIKKILPASGLHCDGKSRCYFIRAIPSPDEHLLCFGKLELPTENSLTTKMAVSDCYKNTLSFPMDFRIPFNMLTLEIRPGIECLLGTTTSYSFVLDFLHDETALGSDTP